MEFDSLCVVRLTEPVQSDELCFILITYLVPPFLTILSCMSGSALPMKAYFMELVTSSFMMIPEETAGLYRP